MRAISTYVTIVVLAHLFNFVLTYYKTSIINLAAAKIEAKYDADFPSNNKFAVSTFEKQSAQFPTLGQSLNNIRALVINKFLGIITDLVSVLVLHQY